MPDAWGKEIAYRIYVWNVYVRTQGGCIVQILSQLRTRKLGFATPVSREKKIMLLEKTIWSGSRNSVPDQSITFTFFNCRRLSKMWLKRPRRWKVAFPGILPQWSKNCTLANFKHKFFIWIAYICSTWTNTRPCGVQSKSIPSISHNEQIVRFWTKIL